MCRNAIIARAGPSPILGQYLLHFAHVGVGRTRMQRQRQLPAFRMLLQSAYE